MTPRLLIFVCANCQQSTHSQHVRCSSYASFEWRDKSQWSSSSIGKVELSENIPQLHNICTLSSTVVVVSLPLKVIRLILSTVRCCCNNNDDVRLSTKPAGEGEAAAAAKKSAQRCWGGKEESETCMWCVSLKGGPESSSSSDVSRGVSGSETGHIGKQMYIYSQSAARKRSWDVIFNYLQLLEFSYFALVIWCVLMMIGRKERSKRACAGTEALFCVAVAAFLLLPFLLVGRCSKSWMFTQKKCAPHHGSLHGVGF